MRLTPTPTPEQNLEAQNPLDVSYEDIPFEPLARENSEPLARETFEESKASKINTELNPDFDLTSSRKALGLNPVGAKPKAPNLHAAISEILTSVNPALNPNAKTQELQASLQKNLATVDEAVSAIAVNMRNAENAFVRQRAAEKILELHGINQKNQGDFTINIITDTNQVNLAQVLNPTRE